MNPWFPDGCSFKKYGLLIILPFLAYIYALNCGFVYDDVAITVVENPALTGQASIGEILTWDRPLREFTYMLDHWLWGFRSFGYHLQNIIWHIANTLLLYIFLNFLGVTEILAFLTALLFSIHPINTEPVVWVSGRKELLCLFFELLASYWFVLSLSKWNETRAVPWKYCSLCLMSLVLALLSKQVAVVSPFLFLAASVFYSINFGIPVQWKRLGAALAGTIVVVLLFVLCSYDLVGRLSVMQERGTYFDPAARNVAYTFLSAVLTPFATFAESIWLYLWPMDLTVERAFVPVTSIWDYRWLLGLGTALLLVITAIRLYVARPAFAFGLFWLILTWGPVSGIAPVAYLLADRYLYIPGIGFYLAVLSLFQDKLKNKIFIVFFILVWVGLSVRTMCRTVDWKDEFHLWNAAVASRPQIPAGYINLGNAYQEKGEYEKALAYWHEALKRKGDLPQVYVNMGNVEKNRGNKDIAEMDYRMAIKLLPEYGLAHYNLGLLLEEKGSTEEALQHLEQATRFMYGKRDSQLRQGLAHYQFARICITHGNIDKAISHLLWAERLYPNYAPLYLLKGLVSKEPETARLSFTQALELNPKYGEAYFYLGLLDWQSGDKTKAEELWKQAVQLNPALETKVEKERAK